MMIFIAKGANIVRTLMFLSICTVLLVVGSAWVQASNCSGCSYGVSCQSCGSVYYTGAQQIANYQSQAAGLGCYCQACVARSKGQPAPPVPGCTCGYCYYQTHPATCYQPREDKIYYSHHGNNCCGFGIGFVIW